MLAHASGGQSVPQVVNAAPAPAVVKVTEANLPVALSDEELDEVSGEFAANAVGAVTGAVAGAFQEMAQQAAGGEKTNWTEVAKSAAGGALLGAISPISSALAVSNTIKASVAVGTAVGVAFKGK